MRRIAWLSEKGGTGKTTSAINSAVGLTKLGLRVLLIDADPQGNASLVLLQGQPADPPTLHHVLLNEADAADAVRATSVERLDILPADASLADANLALAGELGRERRLRLAMKDVEEDYDFVVVDTSPTRSLLNVNVLNYVDEVLVPLDPGLFSLSGLGQLQQAVDDVRRYLDNRSLKIGGLVLTRTASNNVARDVERQVRELFGDLVHATTIPTNAKVEEAHSRYQSVLDYAPRSAGARAYVSLVKEIIANGRGTKDGTGGASDGIAPADEAA